MMTRIRIDDWDELLPYEQVTLVRKGSPDTQLQARFHHAIAARGGGWQAMFEVGGSISTRYTSSDWSVIRVSIGMAPRLGPAVEQGAGRWHNGSSSDRNPIFVPRQRPAADVPANRQTDIAGDPEQQPVGRRRSIRGILSRKGRVR